MRFWRTPLDAHEITIPRGEIHLIVDRCKGCAFCVEYCPCGVLAMSESFNRKGYHPPMVVQAEACVRCELCEMICPEFAIFTEPVGEAPRLEAEAARAGAAEEATP